MEGQVKWFSADKGYGFVTGTDGTDRYFAVRDVVGADLPSNGDSVTFEHHQGHKGPRAGNVVIIKKTTSSSAHHRSDDRVTCPHCQKNMVPRIVIDHGSIRHSLCPFCGGVYKDFTKKCFVASAVYGSASAPEVVVLRRFRDNTLRRFWLGRMFIKAYYRFSPPVANFLAKRPRIASRVRALLDVLVRHCD